MTKKIYFKPFQPDYEKQQSYQEYKVTKENPFYGIVYEFYEFESEKVGTDIVVTALPDAYMDFVFVFYNDHISLHIGAGTGKLYEVKYPGANKVFGLNLVPGALKYLLPIKAVDIAKAGRINLSDMYAFREIESQLMESGSFQKRIDIAMKMLGELYNENIDNVIIQHSVNEIASHIGEMKVEDVAEKVGYSLRYFRKMFTENVGYSPQKFMRIVRFQKSYKALLKGEFDHSLTDISMEYGYYDLSHMNKEYQLLAGCLPCKLMKIVS